MEFIDQKIPEIKMEVNVENLKVPQKVYVATSNEPWGPRGSDHLAEIAQATKKFTDCKIIMNVLWTRLADSGSNWRQVYKALVVMEYLVAHGSETAVYDIIDYSSIISSLSTFEYVEHNGKDMGMNIRKRAETILSLLADMDKIQEIRDKAASNRDKYFGLSSIGNTCMPSSILKGSKNSICSDRHGSLSAVKDGEILKNTYKDREFFDHSGLETNKPDGFILETQGMKAKDVTYTPIKKRKGRSELSEEQISKWQFNGSCTGTTVIAANNTSGLYFMVDGLSFLLVDSDTPEKRAKLDKEKPYRKNCRKLFKPGKDMLSAVHGSNLWSNHILDILEPKIERESWNPEQCAIQTQHILRTHVFTKEDLVKNGFPEDYDLKNASCGIVFGAYIENHEQVKVGSMFYADRDIIKEVIDVHNYHGTIHQLDDDKTKQVGYICLGSGSEYAYAELSLYHSFYQMEGGLLNKTCLTLENGNLTEDEHAYVFLNAMRASTKDIMTGGEILGKYISPSGTIKEIHPVVAEKKLNEAISKLESKVREEILIL